MAFPSCFLFLSMLGCILATEALKQPREVASIPSYVTKYAPLVYLDQNEVYLPSDLQAQLDNTNPTLNFTRITTGPSPLTLSNLDQLDAIGNCTVDDFDACPLYLTSKEDITTNPQWLYGVLPDPTTLKTNGARSAIIIVNDHQDGTVDAFYMFFYAFNLGNEVLGQILGDHVGDLEHVMIRFVNETPASAWYSQHDSGEAYTWDALSKNGTRLIAYSGMGTHASYTVPGTHSRSFGPVKVNDYTSTGPLWDPTLSAYYYTYQPSSSKNGTFTPSDATTPVSWLYFLGRWGDERYPNSDPRQVDFLDLNIEWKYDSGPTGPLDKALNRSGTCPDGGTCTTTTSLPAISGSSISVTVSRTSTTTSATAGIGSSISSASLSSTAKGLASRSFVMCYAAANVVLFVSSILF